MIVTDLNYALEDRLVQVLDYFVKRVTDRQNIEDALLIVNGKTGTGKTNTSLVISYYMKQLSGRDIYLFFRTRDAIDFAKTHKKSIVIVDEPSLDAMSTDRNKMNDDFLRLINTMRMNQHIVIFNMVRFWRFKSDIVADRALCMIHMYDEGKKSRSKGRFIYIRGKKLSDLWKEREKNKNVSFMRFSSIRGNMPERMRKMDSDGNPFFNKLGVIMRDKQMCTLDDYENFRSDEVSKIGETEQKSKKELKLQLKHDTLCYNISQLSKRLGIKQEDIAKALQIHSGRMREWKSLGVKLGISQEKEANSLGKQGFEGLSPPNVLSTRVEGLDLPDGEEEEALDRPYQPIIGSYSHTDTPRINEKGLTVQTGK